MFKIFNQTKLECLYDDRITDVKRAKIRSPHLVTEGSKAGSLTFTALEGVPIDRNDIVYIVKDGDDLNYLHWTGRVLSDESNEYNEKEVECEGALAFLNDSLQPACKRPTRADPGVSVPLKHLEIILDWHNTQFTDDEFGQARRFYISDLTRNSDVSAIMGRSSYTRILDNAIFSIYSSRTRETTLDNINREFLEYFKNGYLRVRSKITGTIGTTQDGQPVYSFHNELDFINAYDTENNVINGQSIEFGKNLRSIRRRASIEDLATVYIPLGRQLTDVEKSWPYYQSIANYKLRRITDSPDTAEEINYYNEPSANRGYYIDSETGACVEIADDSFFICPDIYVYPGDVFFITTQLKGPSTEKSAVTYAILSEDGKVLYGTGSSVRNKKDDQGNVEEQYLSAYDQQITIPTPEDGNAATRLKLRVGRTAYPNCPGLFVRKFNKFYGEDNLTIMSHSTVDSSPGHPIVKVRSESAGSDVYPAATATPETVESFEGAREIYNADLVSEFGLITKTFVDQDAEDVDTLYDHAAAALEKMDEKIETVIEAVDLSYIDDSVPSFQLLYLTHVISTPHNTDLLLPVMKIDLPLDAPENAVYTIQNDVELDARSPKYVSQYVAKTYKTQEKAQRAPKNYGNGGNSSWA